jgi:hypothetical protein
MISSLPSLLTSFIPPLPRLPEPLGLGESPNGADVTAFPAPGPQMLPLPLPSVFPLLPLADSVARSKNSRSRSSRYSADSCASTWPSYLTCLIRLSSALSRFSAVRHLFHLRQPIHFPFPKSVDLDRRTDQFCKPSFARNRSCSVRSLPATQSTCSTLSW